MDGKDGTLKKKDRKMTDHVNKEKRLMEGKRTYEDKDFKKKDRSPPIFW